MKNIKKYLSESNILEKIENENNILDKNVQYISDAITKAAENSIPNKIITVRPNDPPWIACYIKRLNFEIINFPFLDGDVPRSPSYGVYISQLIRFARVCSNVDDFNNRNLSLTAKLLKQGYRYHKIRKAFSKFYYRHSELIVKYNIGLKTLLQQGISEPIFMVI